MGAAVAESLSLEAFCPSWIPELDPTPAVAFGCPLLAVPVPTGFPAPADDRIERHLSLDEHLIRQPESTFLMRVQGDELRDQGIHSGDLLVVDRTAAPSTGSWVVAVVKGEFALRRVGRDAQGRRVVQSAQPDLPLGEGQGVQIWGVVRWNIHRLWPGRLSS